MRPEAKRCEPGAVRRRALRKAEHRTRGAADDLARCGPCNAYLRRTKSAAWPSAVPASASSRERCSAARSSRSSVQASMGSPFACRIDHRGRLRSGRAPGGCPRVPGRQAPAVRIFGGCGDFIKDSRPLRTPAAVGASPRSWAARGPDLTPRQPAPSLPLPAGAGRGSRSISRVSIHVDDGEQREGSAMDPRRLWKRAAALLAAVGVSIFLAGGISADEEIAEAEPAAALQPAQVVADIPTEYDTLFELQWGGGSLSQLAGRLAPRGCAMNTLWVYDGSRWHPYNRYDVPQDAAFIQEFIQRYERDLPAGTFYATCADQPVAGNLQSTQIVAEILEEYDTPFELQWGGGSFLHLKGRLATMGCMVNNISYTDPETNREYTYNQYNTRSTDRTNQQFLQRYEQFIPAGTLTADCYNVCEFGGERCLSFDELREQEGNFRKYYLFSILEIDKTTPCTRNFHPTIQEHILPLLPIRPDACIVLKEKLTDDPDSIGGVGGAVWYYNVNAPPFVAVEDISSLWYRETQQYKDEVLVNGIHELCHINQNYQQVQGLSTEQGFNENNHLWFKNSPQGRAFIEMVEYTDVGSWQWVLPENNVYRQDIYSTNPIELSAELCSMYLLDKIGATQRYTYTKWIPLPNENGYNGYGYFQPSTPTPNFNINTYLTPEVREWLETYMILPEIIEEEAE